MTRSFQQPNDRPADEEIDDLREAVADARDAVVSMILHNLSGLRAALDVTGLANEKLIWPDPDDESHEYAIPIQDVLDVLAGVTTRTPVTPGERTSRPG